MILSNSEIQLALDEGRLVLEPEPWPREREPVSATRGTGGVF